MNGTALALVLAAAVVHAVWSLSAKRVPDGGPHLVFLYYTVSAIVVPPIAVVSVLVDSHRPTWTWIAAGLVTALLHIAYGVVLQRGYDVGDLTVVYPLARGSGPLIAVGWLVLREPHPGRRIGGSVIVLAGIVAIAAG
jgi:drug/metabolite transporter (DMT)-like permease